MSVISRTIRTVFHADLSGHPEAEEYWVQAHGKRHPLRRHTAQTRAVARAAAPRLAQLRDDQLTHFTDAVTMPAAVAMRVHIKHTARTMPEIDAPAVPSFAAMFIPPSDSALLDMGPAAQMHLLLDPVSTAKALAFHHPDLITQNKEIAAVIQGFMDDNVAVSDQFQHLGTVISQMGPPSTDPNRGWATLVPFTPPANEDTGIKGVKTFFMNPTQTYLAQSGQVMTQLMLLAKNSAALAGKKYSITTGQSVLDAAALAPPPPPAPAAQTAERVEAPSRLGRVELAATGDNWMPVLQRTGSENGLTMTLSDIDPTNRRFTLNCSDWELRYLGYYIRFFDADGKTIDLAAIKWVPDNETELSTSHWIRLILGPLIEYDDLQFIGYTSGATTVLGVPAAAGTLGDMAHTGDYTGGVIITMPPGAVAAEVMGSGLGFAGTDSFPKTPVLGSVATALMDLVVPVFMLAGAAALQSNAALNKIVKNLMSNKAFLVTVIGAGIVYLGYAILYSIYYRRIDWSDFLFIAKLLFNKAAATLLIYIETKMAVEELEEEIPFAGWIMLALNVTVGLASMAETVVAISTSPWNITNLVTSRISTTVDVHPDPRTSATNPFFPKAPIGSTSRLVVNFTYRGGRRPTISLQQVVPVDFAGSVLTSVFPDNTLGGEMKIEAYYYIDDWQAAQAATGWMPNDDEHAANVTLYLVENPIPLDASSVYGHTAVLVWRDGAYDWAFTAQGPVATLADAGSGSTGNAISQWSGLALSQRYAMIGYAWKAAGMGITACGSGAGGQLYAMQNVDAPNTPMVGAAFPDCGLIGMTNVVYDPYPPKFLMQNGQWVMLPNSNPPVPAPDPTDRSLGDFWVDSRKSEADPATGGGYHLRMISLDPTPVNFDMAADQLSYARFALAPNSLAIHPSGAVVAVNTASGKLSVAELVPDGAPDDQLPLATDFAGQAIDTGRAGLLFSPVAVSCSYDGTILVLESTRGGTDSFATIPAVARIQAFDVLGNPVNRFQDATGQPTPFLPLEGVGDYAYLDLSVVGDATMTYMYVLYYQGDDSDPANYRMAIYQYGTQAPATNPLVVTDQMPAARLFVDMWHTLYTLNYAMTTDGAGNPAGPAASGTGPDGRTVPSISEWLPPIPTGGDA